MSALPYLLSSIMQDKPIKNHNLLFELVIWIEFATHIVLWNRPAFYMFAHLCSRDAWKHFFTWTDLEAIFHWYLYLALRIWTLPVKTNQDQFLASNSYLFESVWYPCFSSLRDSWKVLYKYSNYFWRTLCSWIHDWMLNR